MKKTFIWVPLFLSAMILAGGCAPLPEQGPKRDFLAICKAKAEAHGGKISKQEFMADALNKEQAEKVFQACDTEQRGYLTEKELFEPQRKRMIQSVIRLTEPNR